MEIKTAKLEITDEFNNCQGGEWLEKELKLRNLYKAIKFVDVMNNSDWRNDRATMVVEITPALENFMAFAKFSVEALTDEYQYRKVGEKYIVRLWWD
jgi:hypothetical protein